MKVFVLGGTGSIGGAVVDVLLARGHQVFALGRSPLSCDSLEKAGAIAVSGDLTDPSKWIHICDNVDGIIHAAATWDDNMRDIDRQTVEVVLHRLQTGDTNKPFIYTGGCWLYGETGNSVATEDSAFQPLASFAYSIPTIQLVLSASQIKGMVIHPAMVYERDGGVFEHIFEDAENLGFVRVIRGEHVRWPLIHRMDLALVYALMLERGEQGDVYNAATNHGVPIGDITRAIAGRLGINADPIVCETDKAIREIGSWAEGYAIDQQMSGDKARSQLGWRPEFEDVFAGIS